MTTTAVLLRLCVFALSLPLVAESQAPPEPKSHPAFVVDATAAPCTVESVTYTTPFDCAVAAAKQWTRRTRTPASIQLGGGTYETRLGLQMIAQDGATIGIAGRGKGEFGGGTVLKLMAPLATGVVTYSYLNPAWNSGYWSNLRLDGFTVDANGNAPQCFDLYALRVAHLTDLSCTGATGPRAWFRVGGYGEDIGGTVPKGMQGLAFQVIASDLFLYNSTTGPGAIVTPVVERGGIPRFRIDDPGLYRQMGPVTAFLKGETAGTPPCEVAPSGLRGVLEPDHTHPGMRRLARILSDTPGSGCRVNLHVAVPDLPPAAYGFEIAATDSSFYDLTDDGVGTTAGIVDRGSDGTSFYHPHAWNVVDMFDAWGHDSLVDPEIDSIYEFGIRVRYGESTTITRPSFIYLPHLAYAAAGDFFFDRESRDTHIVDPICLGRNPNPGYAQLSGPAGPFLPGYGTTARNVERGVPAGLQITAGRSCAPPTVRPSTIEVEPGFATGAVAGRELSVTVRNRSSAPAVPFLLASLPATKQGQSPASLRITLNNGPLDRLPEESVYRVANLAESPAMRQTSSTAANRMRTCLQVYRQVDGSSDVYIALPSRSSAAIKIDMVQSDGILLVPEPLQKIPTGALIEDTAPPL